MESATIMDLKIKTISDDQNKNGILPVTIKIDNGYDGSSTNSKELYFDLEIIGFKKFYSSFDDFSITSDAIGYDNTILPSEIDSSDLEQRVINYILDNKKINFPSDSTLTKVSEPLKNNITGQISFTFIPNKYYNYDGNPVENTINKTITINIFGFKFVGETIISSELTTDKSV